MKKNSPSRVAAFQFALLAAASFILFSILTRQKNNMKAPGEITQKK